MNLPFTKAMDRQVDAQFQKDPSGRLVFLPSGRKGKAYFVESKSDEEKIRAFVKMYRGAGTLIYWVQNLCFLAWIESFTTSAHRWTTEVGIASFFIFVFLLAVWVLWRLYKQTVPTFTASLSEVGPDLRDQLTDVCPPPQRLRVLVLASLFAGVVILGLAIVLATRRAPPKAPCPPKLSSTTSGFR